jgi:hypothetical protein
MITKYTPAPKITVEAPQVKVAAPEVKVSPVIHVAPSEARVMVQAAASPRVDVTVKHDTRGWVFDIERNSEGDISRITATPQ